MIHRYNAKVIDMIVIIVKKCRTPFLRKTKYFLQPVHTHQYRGVCGRELLYAFVCEEKGQGFCASVSSLSVFLSSVAYLFCELH